MALLVLFTLAVMGGVGYAYVREGLFHAATMCFCVIFAGVVAFNFYEPIAGSLETSLRDSVLDGLEDALALVILFGITLALLRVAVYKITEESEVEFHPHVDKGGGFAFGALTGYLASGFLVCVFQTMPWQKNFLGFEPRPAPEEGSTLSFAARAFPADQAWLRIMFRSHKNAFWPGKEPGELSPTYTNRFHMFESNNTDRRFGDSPDDATKPIEKKN